VCDQSVAFVPSTSTKSLLPAGANSEGRESVTVTSRTMTVMTTRHGLV
jgi:hypothetical protein